MPGATGTRDVTVRLLANVAEFKGQMGLAGEAVTEIAEDLSGLDEAIHNTFSRAGRVMLGAGASMTAAASMWGREAVQWQSAFVNVEKTVDATSQELNTLSGQLRGIAANDLPIAAEQLAGLAGAAGQLGVATPDIDEFVETVASLGIATDLSAETASFAMAQFLNVMGESAQATDELGSVLVELGNTTATTESKILDFATRIAGAANVVGIASAEVMGIGAALASAGVESERGGTAVQKVLLAINSAATSGGDKLNTFASVLGMTREEFRELAKQDPTEVFVRFVEALKGAGREADSVLRRLELQDQRLVGAFLSLANSGEDLRGVIAASNEEFGNANALMEETARFTGTVSNQLKVLWNAITEISRSLGAGFVPILDQVLTALRFMLRVVNMIPSPIMALTGLLVGLGGVLFTLAGAAASFSRSFEVMFHARKIAQTDIFTKAMVGVRAGLLGTDKAMKAVADSGSHVARTFLWITNQITQLVGGTIEFLQLRLAPRLMRGGRAAQFFGRILQGMPTSIAQIVAGLRTAQGAAIAFVTSLGGLAAIAAVITGIVMAFRALGREVYSAADASDTLAESLGVTLEELASMEKQVDKTANSIAEFRIQNAALIAQLNKAADAGERAAMLTNLIFRWQLQGAGPEEIEEMVERLREAGVDIPVNLDLSPDIDQQITAIEERIQGIKQGLIFDEGDRQEAKKALEAYASEVASLLAGTTEEQVQGLKLADAIKGQLSDVELRDFFTRVLIKAGRGEELGMGFAEQFVSGFTPTAVKDVEDAINTLAQESATGLQDLAREAEKAGVSMDATFAEKVMFAIEKGLHEPLIAAQKEMENTNSITEDQTRLMSILGDEYEEMAAKGDKAATRAFVKHRIEQMRSNKGMLETIDILEEQLAALAEQGDAYGEFARTVRSELETVRREWEKVRDEQLQALNQMLDQQKALNEERVAAEEQYGEDIAQAREDHAEAVEDLTEDHHERMAELERNRQVQLANAREGYEHQLERINETYHDKLEDRARDMMDWTSLTERIFSEETVSLQRIIANARIQDRMFGAWQEGLAELRRRGLSETAIEALGLAESPRALQQIERILAGTGEQIDELNSLVADRMEDSRQHVEDNSQDLVEEAARGRAEALAEYNTTIDEINSDFQEQADQTRRDFNERMADLRSDLATRLSDIEETFAERMADIKQRVSEIGADTGRDWAKAVEEGLASGIPAIEEQARKVQEMFAQQAAATARSMGDWVAKVRRDIWGSITDELPMPGMGGGNTGFFSGVGAVTEAINEGFSKVLDQLGFGRRGGGPGLSRYQHGGIATSPHMGIMGEAGSEAMIPLNREGAEFMASMLSRYRTPAWSAQDRMLDGIGAMAMGHGNGMNVQHMEVRPIDFRAWREQMNQEQRRKRLLNRGGINA